MHGVESTVQNIFYFPSAQDRKQFIDVLQLCSLVFITHVHCIIAAVTVLLAHHRSPTVTLPSIAAVYADINRSSSSLHL